MRKAKNKPDDEVAARLQVTLGGVARIMGISRNAIYKRARTGKLNLNGIPREVLRTGTWYDLEAIFERFTPGVDDTTRGLLIFEFIKENARVIR